MKPVNVKLPHPPQSSFKYKKIKLETLNFNWHCHPEYEIMFMHHSRGKRFIGNNIDYYKEGDLFFIGANLPHTWYSAAGVMGKNRHHEAILVQFAENFAGLNLHEIPEFTTIHQLLTKASRGIQIFGKTKRIVAKKLVEMETLDGLGRFVSLITILDTLSKAIKNDKKILSSIEFNGFFNSSEQNRIDRVCTYINQHYRQKLSLEEAASRINMSTTAFSRFFKKSTGKTFVNYVNELRIGLACKLLIETEMNVSEICYEVGFNNLSNFNRRFHERHHMSPREYRREFTLKF